MILLTQMSILLTLFFTSLLCIIFMIGRKLAILQNVASPSQEILFEIPYLREIRHLTLKNARKLGHLSLVMTLRVYIRSSNSFKNKYQEIKSKIKNRARKSTNEDSREMEVNKFLKMMSEYKHKIRKIKQKIHEEEKKS